jgi:hypothetical protein
MTTDYYIRRLDSQAHVFASETMAKWAKAIWKSAYCRKRTFLQWFILLLLSEFVNI